MQYHCEYAERSKTRDFPQLMCRLRVHEEPKTIEEKATCTCGHQYYCRITGKWENTSGCTNCSMKGGTAR